MRAVVSIRRHARAVGRTAFGASSTLERPRNRWTTTAETVLEKNLLKDNYHQKVMVEVVSPNRLQSEIPASSVRKSPG